MTEFKDLPRPWQRVFELEWESVCRGSRAIAAVITDRSGEIISEARNRTGERLDPNPKTAHAENTAVGAIDTSLHPDLWACTLYAGLEPCLMCMGTIVMGGIRHIEIGAKDSFGGAMKLIDLFDFARAKNIEIVWRDGEFGDIQRGLQALRELLYCTDSSRLDRILADFSELNRPGVEAARAIVSDGTFDHRDLSSFTAEEIYNKLVSYITYTEEE